MPVDPAEPVVTALAFLLQAGQGAITRHSLRPLRFFEAKLPAALGRETRRGIAVRCFTSRWYDLSALVEGADERQA